MSFSERWIPLLGRHVDLTSIDANASGKLSREHAKRKTLKTIGALAQLQYLLYANADRSVLIILQGPDASGKDGLIKHLFEGLNPQGVVVTAFRQPTEIELAHDFLWRVHSHAPAKGEIAVFNRSHYEAVLVERVRGLVARSEWETRYAAINAFEQLLTQNGTRVLKFYLHIDADEQLERFRKRLDDKRKRWKISEDDYTDRELWPQFVEANEDMLEKTSTPGAPWYIIPSNHKWYRNYAVSKIVTGAMREMGLKIPKPSVDVEAIRAKYHVAKRSNL